ncbi:MAG: hypothetical protein LUG91_00290 [Ruminococcus sp.]|nr:hypothetical protein [Ruminococcus sp.]
MLTLYDILGRKALEVAGTGYKNNGLKLDPGQRKLADVIYKLHCSDSSSIVEEFMETMRRAAIKAPYTVSYVPGLDNLFKECERQRLIQRNGYSLTYKINVDYEGVTDFIQKGYATFAVMDAIKSKVNARIDEMYYNVNLRDKHGNGNIHVDIMYRINETAYFVLVFMNKDLLNQNQIMIDRVNRTLFGPVNRLRSNVSIVISPSVNLIGVVEIMKSYKDSQAHAPRVARFNKLNFIIPNS